MVTMWSMKSKGSEDSSAAGGNWWTEQGLVLSITTSQLLSFSFAKEAVGPESWGGSAFRSDSGEVRRPHPEEAGCWQLCGAYGRKSFPGNLRIYHGGISREKLCLKIKGALGWPSLCAAFLGILIVWLRSGGWGRKRSITGTGWDLQRGFRAQLPGPTPDSLKGQVEARAHLVFIWVNVV